MKALSSEENLNDTNEMDKDNAPGKQPTRQPPTSTFYFPDFGSDSEEDPGPTGTILMKGQQFERRSNRWRGSNEKPVIHHLPRSVLPVSLFFF